MKNILIVQSSPRLKESTSRKVVQNFIEQIKSKHGEAKITTRDLALNPLPHLSYEAINGFAIPAEKRSTEEARVVELSDTLIQEVLDADTIILATPMWNFGVPSVVKAWIDHISRAGKTFAYGPNGITGLAGGKKVYVVTSSGSVFSEGPYKPMDMLGPYLRTFFGFIGITDVTFIRAEGIRGVSEEEAALIKTKAEIQTLLSL